MFILHSGTNQLVYIIRAKTVITVQYGTFGSKCVLTDQYATEDVKKMDNGGRWLDLVKLLISKMNRVASTVFYQYSPSLLDKYGFLLLKTLNSHAS